MRRMQVAAAGGLGQTPASCSTEWGFTRALLPDQPGLDGWGFQAQPRSCELAREIGQGFVNCDATEVSSIASLRNLAARAARESGGINSNTY